MTFRLVLMVCSMLGGEPECWHEERPQPYLSFKECADAAMKERARWWKCVMRPGEESA